MTADLDEGRETPNSRTLRVTTVLDGVAPDRPSWVIVETMVRR
jgi:hypothetical protein